MVEHNNTAMISNDSKYRALVIDSGPIIKLTGVSALRDRADAFYTVPAVIHEIRDAKARQHLQSLPFDIQTREPMPQSVAVVTEFARLTGDFQSLSRVDLLVLALVYELEKEGCGVEHIRTTPKRTVGVGKIELLHKKKNAVDSGEAEGEKTTEEDVELEYDEVEVDDDEDEQNDQEKKSFFEQKPTSLPDTADRSVLVKSTCPRSWAALVNPSKAATSLGGTEKPVMAAFAKMNLNNNKDGQFSDAEGDGNLVALPGEENNDDTVVELEQDFPSLAAASHVPYVPEDDEMQPIDYEAPAHIVKLEEKEKLELDRKQQAVEPITNSGKLYNSFRGYNKLFKPVPKKAFKAAPTFEAPKMNIVAEDEYTPDTQQSRIMGGANMSGQEVDVEDDGEGWITSTKDIRSLQNTGSLAPAKNPLDETAKQGPPLCLRAACATTDFAMQNVLLQIGLELLSVDGVKIRRLKNWVTRCGACFKVYTKNDDAGPHGMKRLFCERCGSDMLQRIAASVDGKTGRLRLHMSKKHKASSTRGTKFSLPKPGTGNRFQGDLLLREDQLMMGAWNQKVKIRSGGHAKNAAQSMFGQDIAANVGCNAISMGADDISAGFGRRNPNAAKGRERRGKKKKSSEKACGLRRYH